jgi:ribose transport system ATP-binding protein
MQEPAPIVDISGLAKQFGATQALSNVHIKLYPGSVHAIVGENGAGKSTLMKILAGIHQSDGGSIQYKKQSIRWNNPSEARQAGISIIFQEFALIPQLSVLENLILDNSSDRISAIPKKLLLEKITKHLDNIGVSVDPARLIGSLTVSEQQLVEIAKGLLADADVFIFDEPTAALSGADEENLLSLVKNLREKGKAIFYISHRLHEVLELSDEVTVLKDGNTVFNCPTRGLTEKEMIRNMVGREPSDMFPNWTKTQSDTPVLAVEGLESEKFAGPVSFNLYPGEIIGLAGLEGQGQRDLIRALYGIDRITSGRLLINGNDFSRWDVQNAVSSAVGLLPEDRKSDGLFLNRSIADNIMSACHAQRGAFRLVESKHDSLQELAQSMNLRFESFSQLAGELSGGNQQKLLIGRWLLRGVSVLLCEEPTRGVDVGSRAEIYQLLREYTQQGGCVLVTSRDLIELLGLCDRLLVVFNQKIVSEFQADETTEDEVVRAAFGQTA